MLNCMYFQYSNTIVLLYLLCVNAYDYVGTNFNDISKLIEMILAPYVRYSA